MYGTFMKHPIDVHAIAAHVLSQQTTDSITTEIYRTCLDAPCLTSLLAPAHDTWLVEFLRGVAKVGPRPVCLHLGESHESCNG